ncbi:hypothetical protein EIN_178420 [Entamoeba invadens IP1]|uniref:hypothetical protein n=1 Tax=Entamoeba invadens IP1 TaxID=370355 RepID=UPI0002C3E852|nr:hypothetical protein EIN_178420 [Entamoeba invadens IP1]ELP93905.1 hypothetical protein EIN_178420 [Entamoeba invadens IP1]|eukprot:XP_004260676.1 hypothetical protein EIN_178420 [Entamoeba invadens IP1]
MEIPGLVDNGNYYTTVVPTNNSIFVNCSDGCIYEYTHDLTLKYRYEDVNALCFQKEQISDETYGVDKEGSVFQIDSRTNTLNYLFKPKNSIIEESGIDVKNNFIGVAYNEVLKMIDKRKGVVIYKIDEAHSDNIISVNFLDEETVVTGSQDGLCCTLNFKNRNEGIIDTVNIERPISYVAILSSHHYAIQSDDNTFVLYNYNTKETEVQVDDFRLSFIQSTDLLVGSSMLPVLEYNKKILVGVSTSNGEVIYGGYEGTVTHKTVFQKHTSQVRDWCVFNDRMYTVGEDLNVFSLFLKSSID